MLGCQLSSPARERRATAAGWPGSRSQRPKSRNLTRGVKPSIKQAGTTSAWSAVEIVDWRQKARIQGMMAMLPPRLGDPLYYALQRRAGGLREINPAKALASGVSVAGFLASEGFPVEGARCLEIGTGRAPGFAASTVAVRRRKHRDRQTRTGI